MKKLFLFASMMLSVTAYSQWEVGNYVDEFGEETGDIYFYQTVIGTFSNFVSKNEMCEYYIEHNKKEKVLAILIYPYGNSSEFWLNDSFQNVKIKKPSGETVIIEGFCVDGMIYFDFEEYTQLMGAISERGEYSVAMTHTTCPSESSYGFKFRN